MTRSTPNKIAAGFLLLVLAALAVVAARYFLRDTAEPPAIRPAAQVPVLRPGDCVDDVHGDKHVVSCGKPHEGEVFGQVKLPEGRFAHDFGIEQSARSQCLGQFPGYATDDDAMSRLDYVYQLPTVSGGTVSCIATDPAGPMIGSLSD